MTQESLLKAAAVATLARATEAEKAAATETVAIEAATHPPNKEAIPTD